MTIDRALEIIGKSPEDLEPIGRKELETHVREAKERMRLEIGRRRKAGIRRWEDMEPPDPESSNILEGLGLKAERASSEIEVLITNHYFRLAEGAMGSGVEGEK